METLIFTLVGFAAVLTIMSVGILFKRSPIKGSCGGIASLMGKQGCDICEHKDKCTEEEKTQCTGSTEL